MSSTKTTIFEIPIQGMDCADCTRHVQHAIRGVPGVARVEVFLASEKAIVEIDPGRINLPAIQQAVEKAGYKVDETRQAGSSSGLGAQAAQQTGFTRPVLLLLGLLFAVILFIVIFGEWLGWFDWLNELLPWWAGVAVVLLAGYPVFRNVLRAARQRQVTSHTLMSLGVIAALAVGEWLTALVVVFFMRVGDGVERFTAEQARRALKELSVLAPQMARLEVDGVEVEIPAAQVQPGQVVIVRPGEVIPVDGMVVGGRATIDQAAITGESMPVEAGPGTKVYAATIAQLGSLQIQAHLVGSQTTFGQITQLVDEAERNKAPVERMADRFSAYYLPLVAGIALATLLLRGDPLASAAVLVVACSCAFALATPIAMLASIGAAAQHGLMIKGGKYIELLAKAQVVLIDKTGTLTLGKPQIVEICLNDPSVLRQILQVRDHLETNGEDTPTPGHNVPFDELQIEILRLAASAERYSEHPLAEALRQAAREHDLALEEVRDFSALPGVGVRAMVNGYTVQVGRQRWLEKDGSTGQAGWTDVSLSPELGDALQTWQDAGKTPLFVWLDGLLAGAMAATDKLRPEIPQALEAIRMAGIQEIELLTGDREATAATLAGKLGVSYRAELLPQDKLQIVKAYQAQGKTVIMVGDGVNDAPALAQADVGIAMGAAGSHAAIEAAHVALMREDWLLVPDSINIARRTMRVVRGNIAFTALYNLVGLSLAAFGILPPMLAAAAQSLPDLGILANSARLLRQPASSR